MPPGSHTPNEVTVQSNTEGMVPPELDMASKTRLDGPPMLNVVSKMRADRQTNISTDKSAVLQERTSRSTTPRIATTSHKHQTPWTRHTNQRKQVSGRRIDRVVCV